MKDAIIGTVAVVFVGIPLLAGITTQRLANEERTTLEGITQSVGAVGADGLKTIFYRHQPERLGPTVQEASEQIKEMEESGQIRQIRGGTATPNEPNLGDKLRDLLPGGNSNPPYNQRQQFLEQGINARGSGRSDPPPTPAPTPDSNWIE